MQHCDDTERDVNLHSMGLGLNQPLQRTQTSARACILGTPESTDL